jgi:hypothetical protein
MIAATLPLASGFWQASHPTPTLAKLYDQESLLGHAALDFEPRLELLLRALAVGLIETLTYQTRRQRHEISKLAANGNLGSFAR